MTIGIALGIGLAAGVLSGVLGIGGGLVSIPGMVLLLGVDQKVAQGVALAVMVFTALVGGITHYRQGNVRLGIVAWLAPAAVGFAILGAWVAGASPSELLTRLFGVALLLVGARMLLAK